MTGPRTTPTNRGESLTAAAGWTPVLVHWEQWYDDDGREPTEVVRSCKQCYRARGRGRWPLPKMTQGREGQVPFVPILVSPHGVAHLAYRGDTTDCGHDCTGPDWWHRA